MGALGLVPAVAAAAGFFLASREVGAIRRGVAFSLAILIGVTLGLDGGSSPLATLSVSIVAAALAIALATDLRDRLVDLRLLLGATGLSLLAALADRALTGTDPLTPLFASLTAVALAGAMWLGGALYARLRGVGTDPLTGGRAEAFGSGDIPAWALAGVGLATPTLVVNAFVISLLVGAVMSLGVLAVRGRGRVADESGNAPDEAFVPFLPAIIAGCAIALLVAR
jgi:prepilin signal peptidase PulO-like enzyme (type II secretory pathway)